MNSVQEMSKNYQSRLEFERYLNPKGLKPTITSGFKKPAKEIDFVSHTFALMRTPKPYGDKVVNFRCDNFLSKPEIRQYLQKLYGMPITAVGTFRKMGKLMKNSDTRTGWRKQDWKKATVTLEHDVESEFQKNI